MKIKLAKIISIVAVLANGFTMFYYNILNCNTLYSVSKCIM